MELIIRGVSTKHHKNLPRNNLSIIKCDQKPLRFHWVQGTKGRVPLHQTTNDRRGREHTLTNQENPGWSLHDTPAP